LSLLTSISLFEFALSLHTKASAIQAYIENHEDLKFDSDCDVWVNWYSKHACNIEEFKKIAGITDDNIES
jgi:hypothetical protein